jgi:glycosyltransferase involved in cell wall biosynthesis
MTIRDRPYPDPCKLPLVSVIVTTRNEEKNLPTCLQSVTEQTYPRDRMEIIVVDNCSTDGTKELALRYTEKVHDRGPERSAQRNYGVEKASGDYILYLDADMILSPDVVRACVEKVEQNPELLALHISEIILGESYFSRVRRFERSFYDGTVIDGVRFINKEVLRRAGGFDVSLTGPEDWDLDKKIRLIGRTDLVTEPIYHNEAAFNLCHYVRKKRNYAHSFDVYINKWGRDDPDIRRQFGPMYRLLVVFVENGKWKRLLTNPYLAVGMYLLRSLVGLAFVLRRPGKGTSPP